ncbi:MAG: M24 family metallopeptidase [Patescibacteria group bacterium]
MNLIKIRSACKLADAILAEVVGNLRRGKSEMEVAAEIRKLAKTKTDGLAFPPIVAFGKNSAEPHHSPTGRKLKIGDIVKIDLGFRVGGFCSDLTRTFFTAEPTDFQRKIYETVLAAQKLGIRKTRSGITGKDLDAFARNFFESVTFPPFAKGGQGGFAKNFVHSLGHGVGRRIHQNPKIGPKSKSTLKLGDVLTIEPGLYFKNRFGIRIEDTVSVGKNGAELLTHFPKKLKILKIG